MSSTNDFSVVWGGAVPSGEPELNLMHTREHMIEHMHILPPGSIISARKYCDGDGNLPKFATIYEMPTIDAMLHPVYGLPATAERSDRSIRGRATSNHSRDWIRHNCRGLAEVGGGIGGSAAFFLFQFDDGGKAVGASQLEGLVQRESVTAARLGLSDSNIRGMPGRETPPRDLESEPAGILIAESYTRLGLVREMKDIERWLKDSGIMRRLIAAASYALSYAVDAEDERDKILLKY